MKNSNRIVFFCGIVSLLLSIGNLFIFFLTKQLIDTPDFLLVVKLGTVWLISALIAIIKNYIVQRRYLQEQKTYIGSLLRNICSFPFSFLESKQYNDEFNHVKGAVSQEQAFVAAIESMISAGFGIFGLYFLLLHHVPIGTLLLLSVLLFAVIALSSYINGKLSALMYDYWKRYIENTRKYNYISNVLSSKEYVEEKKVYAYVPFFSSEFNKEFDFASQKNRTLGGQRIKLELLSDAIFFLYSIFGFLMLLDAYRKSQVTIGLFISGTGYLLSLLGSISGAVGTIEDITKYKEMRKDCKLFYEHAEASAEADDAEAGTEASAEADAEAGAEASAVANAEANTKTNTEAYSKSLLPDSALSIKEVRFKYPANEKLVIDKVSLTFQKGKKYAIVGANGSGKTTLAKIMSGLYSPLSGSVAYNSRPVVLFQDFNKYPLTLKENITLSEKLEMSDKNRLLDIEKNSGLMKRIASMKFGDDTELTTLMEDGEELSGGEWQRVALARILWSNADMYILDEPTASLDPIDEIRIFETYHKILQNRTVLFITHRLGFVKNVDEIIVLNEGRIAETGTHDELLKRQNGIYKKMFEEQRSWYE